MPSDDPKFACPACGKQYRWKPEMAGRSAKCACGAKVTVPAEAPAAPAPLQPAPAQPAPAAPAPASPSVAAPVKSTCPECAATLPAGAVLCVSCGFNLKTGKKLSSVIVEADDSVENDGEDEIAARDKTPTENRAKIE